MNFKGRTFLLVVNDRAWFWSHRLPLAKDILAQGATLHLATDGASSDDGVRALGITGHDLPAHTGSFNPAGQLLLFWRIFQTLHALKPDVVHAITLRHAFFTGLASRIALTPRAVFTVAGVGSLFQNDNLKVRLVRAVLVPMLRVAFGGAGRMVIFQNPDDARALVRAGAIPKDRCRIIRGSGVDPVQFPHIPEPESAPPVILFSSRLLKSKGIGEFVHAARIIKSKGIDARFLVAGDVANGNHDSVTTDQMKDWTNEGAVEWLGHRTDIPDLMAQSNIVCLPSYYGEGVPKVLLEAASTGRAIVTTDMPGCREAIKDKETGLLVAPKNAWSLAAALETLILDPVLRQSMGDKARAYALSDFTVEIVNAKTLAIYKKLFGTSEPEKGQAA